MRPTRLNARLPVVAALGAAIAATALIGTAQAGDSGRAFDEQIFHNILTGIGLQDPNAPQPDYRERSPLVIPNGDSLPKPGTAGAAVANNPAWPKDPDIERAKALAKERKHQIRSAEEQLLDQERVLPPDQLGPKYPGRRTASQGSNAGSLDMDSRQRLSPSQLGYTGGLFSNMFGSDSKEQEAAQFTGEPARTSLTEPPPGYQTPSPSQPYGLNPKNAKPKADNYYLSHGEVDLNN